MSLRSVMSNLKDPVGGNKSLDLAFKRCDRNKQAVSKTGH